jgi:hypothetical protein
VCDLLRDFLLRGDESENASLWSDAQRDEFIARVFRRVLFSSHWSPYDPVRAVHADP